VVTAWQRDSTVRKGSSVRVRAALMRDRLARPARRQIRALVLARFWLTISSMRKSQPIRPHCWIHELGAVSGGGRAGLLATASGTRPTEASISWLRRRPSRSLVGTVETDAARSLRSASLPAGTGVCVVVCPRAVPAQTGVPTTCLRNRPYRSVSFLGAPRGLRGR
jgi:hypothetical protein